MNWLLIAVVLILVGYAIKGGKVGFIKTVFSIFSVVIALVLSITISPSVGKILQNNEKINTSITTRIEKIIKLEETDTKVTDEVEVINGLNLPKSLKNSLIENNNTEMYKALSIHNFKEYISSYLAAVIINALSFIIVFIVINIILLVLSSVLGIISKLPILNGLNKTAGILVGLLQGLIVIWVLCIVLTASLGTKSGQYIYELVNQSKLLSSIYNNNILLNVVTNLAKILF